MIGNWMSASVQDPMFGINHANIASELTASNWRRKAIVRNGLYIWVVRGWQTTGNGGKRSRYYVQIHSGQSTNKRRIASPSHKENKNSLMFFGKIFHVRENRGFLSLECSGGGVYTPPPENFPTSICRCRI